MSKKAEEFRKRVRRKARESRQAFEGKYKEELDELLGLSKKEIKKILPETEDMQIYEQLITVVKEASRINLNQAELKKNIEELGKAAVDIAKKIPSLAKLFI
ncbi:hypothetical protein ACSSWA_05225 [Melioribacter sp. Ez-97]|uniref:hypothetical protein n=1 Tax=Melioribacter sp. Ez-97 TaxID=3423434 RepID=UPI003EDA71B4